MLDTGTITWYPPAERVVIVFTPAPDWREQIITRLEAEIAEQMTEPEASMVATVEALDA